MARSKEKWLGATYIVQLPIPGIRSLPLARSAAKTATLQGLRVMLVEDELDTREIVAEELEQYGARVLQAASGAEALLALAVEKLDVLVSDIGMPEMDGYELMEKIRSEFPPRIRGIPAVALTAFASEDDKEKSFHAGFQAYLVKPIAMSELISAIAAVAGRTDQAQ